MDNNQKLSGRQQRDSIVQAYNNPAAAREVENAKVLQRLKATIGGVMNLEPARMAVDGSALPPATPEAEVDMSQLVPPEARADAAMVHPDRIAAMQQANAQQAANDPVMAAKLEAMRRLRMGQEGQQMRSLSSLPTVRKPAGPEVYPAEE